MATSQAHRIFEKTNEITFVKVPCCFANSWYAMSYIINEVICYVFVLSSWRHYLLLLD